MRKKLKVIILLLVLLGISALLIIYVNFKSKKSILETYLFIPKQSISVGDIADLETQAQDINNNMISINGRKIFIFSDKYCGSCYYITFPLIEWVREFSKINFYYIEISDQIPLIYSELKLEPNFHIISDSNKYFYNSFKEPSTPSVFFVEENNKVVWKSTGFLITDYEEYEIRISEFSQGKVSFDDYQYNINIGGIFPQITYNDKDTIINLPNDFSGSPTLLFFLYSSREPCKNIIDFIPSSVSGNSAINKVIIFAGITEQTINENIDFARHFSLKDIELQAKQAELSKYIDLNYILSKIKDFQNTIVIEDNFFKIPERVGLVGGPFACILDSKGEILSINALGFNNVAKLKKFFEECLKILEERRQ